MIHQTFLGSIRVLGFDIFYEGHERDWEVIGFEEWQNKQLGPLVEIWAITPFLDSFPDGSERYEIGTGKTLEEAIIRLREHVAFAYGAQRQREIGPDKKMM